MHIHLFAQICKKSYMQIYANIMKNLQFASGYVDANFASICTPHFQVASYKLLKYRF